MDATTGEVTVDLPRIWSGFLAGSSGARLLHAATLKPGRSTVARETFEWLTGETLPRGIMPLSLPLIVAAVDDSDRQDWLHANLLVRAPEREVAAAARTRRGTELQDVVGPSTIERREERHKWDGKTRVKRIRERTKRLQEELKDVLDRLARIERKLQKP